MRGVNVGQQIAPLVAGHDDGANAGLLVLATLQKPHHSHLALESAALHDARAPAGVHVARLAADVGFVYLDFAAKLAAVLRLQRKTQAREHEPRGFLGHTERTAKLVAADAVLAVGEQPQGGQPLLKAHGGILEDGAHLERELRPRMLLVALVAALLRQVGHAFRAAVRAHDRAIGPPDRLHRLAAVLVVREETNRFKQGLGLVRGGHEHIMANT